MKIYSWHLTAWKLCKLTRTIGSSYSFLKVRDVPSSFPSHAKSNKAHISCECNNKTLWTRDCWFFKLLARWLALCCMSICFLFVTLVSRALFFLCFVSLFVTTLVSRAMFSLCSVWLSVTLVSRALFSLWSVWLFVTLVSRALFSLCSVWLFVTLVSRALFSLCSVWLSVTLVSHALFSLCSV